MKLCRGDLNTHAIKVVKVVFLTFFAQFAEDLKEQSVSIKYD